MKTREKILLIGLVAMVIVWYGRAFVTGIVFGPITAAQARIRSLQSSIDKKEEIQDKIDRALANQKIWARRSLPPDPLAASTLYRNWLIELTSKSFFSDVTVTPGRVETKPKGDTYCPIPCVIKAQARLSRLCDFLYDFHQAGLMQKVVRMSLECKADGSDPLLDIVLHVEALSLTNSPPRKTLFADDDPKEISKLASKVKERSEYDAIEKKNIFVRGYQQTEKPADPAEKIFLSSILSDGAKPTAWLYDKDAGKRTTVLTEGANFDVASVSGSVLSIHTTYVVLKIKDEAWRLSLGKNLRQIVKQPTEQPPSG